MPKRRDPEQRSTKSAPQPGQAPAKPTGNEVYETRTPGAQQQGPAQEAFTEEELAEIEDLREAAAQAYDRLSDAAFELSDRVTDAYEGGRAFVRDNPTATVVGAFAVGVLLGMFSSD